MIRRNYVVKLVCTGCMQESTALNDKTDADIRAWGEYNGWRSVGDKDWCPGCVAKGRAKP